MIRRAGSPAKSRLPVFVTGVVIGVFPVRAAEWSVGRWLVDLGRDYAVARRERAVEADATIALCFMEAAARLEPGFGEAYYWQLDLLSALGRQADAVAALDRYVACTPDDHAARLMLIVNRLDALQTTEDRRAFCEEYLKRTDLGHAVVSDLHRRIAEYHYNRGELAMAEKRTRQALDAFAMNLAAMRLGFEFSEADDLEADRVKTTLAMVAANPAQPALIWELARYLDDLSLHKEAQFWYGYILETASVTHSGFRPSADFLVDQARSQLDGGDPKAAMKTCNKAIEQNPAAHDARLLMIQIGSAVGDEEVIASHTTALRKHYRQITSEVRKQKDVARAAEMAWFYSRYASAKELASGFARIAAGAPVMNAFTRRAVGYAQLINERYDKAIELLAPLAGEDQLAAVGLARAYIKSGQSDKAVKILQAAARLRYTGQAHDEIVSMLADAGAKPPAPPGRDAVGKALAQFDRRVLRFFRNPNKYLTLEMIPEGTEWAPGQPWTITFRLKNIGPFPITLGEELMVAPGVVLSAVTVGDRERRFDHYLRLALNRRQALLPNEFVEVATTVDIGPLRSAMYVTPQVKHEITFSLLLDPVRSQSGELTHRLGALTVKPMVMIRTALNAVEPQVAILLSQARGGNEAQRAEAVGLLASLLAEHDRLGNKVLDYPHQSINANAILQMLVDRSRDKSPLVRSRTMEAIRFVRPRDQLLKATAPRISDPNWLVRLMTLYAFAEWQGRVFTKVLARAARSDPDPLIRRFAAAYSQRLAAEAATSAETKPSTP